MPLDTFYRAINKVERSLIRTDADEVTYNLHVMLRFDLELDLLEGRLAVKDIPDAWRARMQADLGVAPPDDRDGCLQDVHWYYGGIGGAFQGYTIGNILSAQFYAAAVKANPGIPSEIAAGEFGTLHGWLTDNLYRHGRQVHAQRPDQARHRRADDHAALSCLSARQVRRALFVACRGLIAHRRDAACLSPLPSHATMRAGQGGQSMRVRTCLISLGAVFVAGGVLIAAWTGGTAAPAHRFADKRPNAMPVDVELVIAVDVSNSMDPEEQELQREGYVAALTSREFLTALRSGAHGKVAVTYFEWAGLHDQTILMPWRLIDSPESADAVAREIARAPYRRAPRTSIYGALQFAKPLFDASGYRGLRQVIDVSGDGVNNMGPPVAQMRDEVLAAGITINGLPIMLRRQIRLRHVGHGVRASRRLLRGLRHRRAGLVRDLDPRARAVQGGDPHQAGDGGRGRDAGAARRAGAGQEAAGVLLVGLSARSRIKLASNTSYPNAMRTVRDRCDQGAGGRRRRPGSVESTCRRPVAGRPSSTSWRARGSACEHPRSVAVRADSRHSAAYCRYSWASAITLLVPCRRERSRAL